MGRKVKTREMSERTIQLIAWLWDAWTCYAIEGGQTKESDTAYRDIYRRIVEYDPLNIKSRRR